MRSTSESARAASAEAALLEKIEELSFLRSLNDCLTRVPDFASAARALVDLVWEERQADAVAYFSVDSQRRVCRLEAAAPPNVRDEVNAEFGFDQAPFATFVREADPVVMQDVAEPPWHAVGRGTRRPGVPSGPGVLISAPSRVRGTTTGLLLVFTHAAVARPEEDRRLLAITATSAALALDVARNHEREEFLATLRHDINNPVGAALGYTEMIIDRLQSGGDTDLLALAGSVVESLKAVADLVSNYLSMAAIDRGVPWLNFAELDLGDLAQEVVSQHRPSAAEKRLVLACDGACPRLRADRRQLARVVSNLVSNAIKYTPGPGQVDVRVGGDATGATLVVADTGYGIPRAALPQLFAKYARFHRDKGIPGTGLGLYISRAIVEAHGGSLSVASEPGRGSTFTVRIPHRPV